MKNKKFMLLAVGAMGLVAVATAGVGTAAWFEANNNTTITGSATKTYTVADPEIDIGSTINLQIIVELCDNTGKVDGEGGYSAPTGMLLSHYNSSGGGSLETYYLDGAGAPHIYTPAAGSYYFYAYKITVKSPTTDIAGDDAVALRSAVVQLSAARANSSAAVFQGFVADFASVNGKVADSATSISVTDIYTFASDLTSMSANTVLATKYIGVRVDGGAISGTGLEETSGNALKADFTISANKK
ncbi:MAG: hypothetical protein K6C32_04880 [Bacilli bacterium]|nr:hypothetical protein [Bacilli bacterium]